MAGGLQRTPHSSTAATRGASRPRCGGCSGDPALPRPSPFPEGPEPPAHPARVSSIRALGTSRKVLVAGRGCGTRGPSSDALPCSSGRGGQKGHATGEELAALQAAARTRQGWGHPEEGCHGGAELHGAVAPPPWQRHRLLRAESHLARRRTAAPSCSARPLSSGRHSGRGRRRWSGRSRRGVSPEPSPGPWAEQRDREGREERSHPWLRAWRCSRGERGEGEEARPPPRAAGRSALP